MSNHFVIIDKYLVKISAIGNNKIMKVIMAIVIKVSVNNFDIVNLL